MSWNNITIRPLTLWYTYISLKEVSGWLSDSEYEYERRRWWRSGLGSAKGVPPAPTLEEAGWWSWLHVRLVVGVGAARAGRRAATCRGRRRAAGSGYQGGPPPVPLAPRRPRHAPPVYPPAPRAPYTSTPPELPTWTRQPPPHDAPSESMEAEGFIYVFLTNLVVCRLYKKTLQNDWIYPCTYNLPGSSQNCGLLTWRLRAAPLPTGGGGVEALLAPGGRRHSSGRYRWDQVGVTT